MGVAEIFHHHQPGEGFRRPDGRDGNVAPVQVAADLDDGAHFAWRLTGRNAVVGQHHRGFSGPQAEPAPVRTLAGQGLPGHRRRVRPLLEGPGDQGIGGGAPVAFRGAGVGPGGGGPKGPQPMAGRLERLIGPDAVGESGVGQKIEHQRIEDLDTGEGHQPPGGPGLIGLGRGRAQPDDAAVGGQHHRVERWVAGHHQGGRVVVAGVKAVDGTKIHPGDDVAVDHQEGASVPEIPQVGDGAAGAQKLRLMADDHRNFPLPAGQGGVDRRCQVVGVHRHRLAACGGQLADEAFEHRSTPHGKQRLGDPLGPGAKSGPRAGGQHQGFHRPARTSR